MPINRQPVIQAQHITFHYPQQTEKVLDDVGLDVEKGDFLGVIGPNGSGKSTLLKILLRVLKPEKGSVQVFGKPIEDFKDWQKIGYVPQRANVNEQFVPITVEEAVGLGQVVQTGFFHPFGMSEKEKVLRALMEVEMEEYRDRPLQELSGGQQQRVLIAKALVSSPELLILDEPTTGVDSQSEEKFYELLRKLNQKGLTLIIVSHDIDVVLHEVNKVACLNKKLVYHGDPAGMQKSEYLEKMYGHNHRFVMHHHG